MECLYCGECCLRYSPISSPEPCPHLIKDETFYFCKCYKERPDDCKNHDYPGRFCPIGLDKLKLSGQNIAHRIDDGWQRTKEITT